MNGDTADVIADHLALASMETRANLDAERLDLLGYCMGAANTTCWSIKRGEKSVPSRFDLVAAKAYEIATDCGVMILQ